MDAPRPRKPFPDTPPRPFLRKPLPDSSSPAQVFVPQTPEAGPGLLSKSWLQPRVGIQLPKFGSDSKPKALQAPSLRAPGRLTQVPEPSQTLPGSRNAAGGPGALGRQRHIQSHRALPRTPRPGQASLGWGSKSGPHPPSRGLHSILKTKLLQKSVEYYRPLRACERKLGFRRKFSVMTQEQRLKRKVNSEIRARLRPGRAEPPINTIFVGKNKVVLKKVVQNGPARPRKRARRRRRAKSAGKLFSARHNRLFYQFVRKTTRAQARGSPARAAPRRRRAPARAKKIKSTEIRKAKHRGFGLGAPVRRAKPGPGLRAPGQSPSRAPARPEAPEDSPREAQPQEPRKDPVLILVNSKKLRESKRASPKKSGSGRESLCSPAQSAGMQTIAESEELHTQRSSLVSQFRRETSWRGSGLGPVKSFSHSKKRPYFALSFRNEPQEIPEREIAAEGDHTEGSTRRGGGDRHITFARDTVYSVENWKELNRPLESPGYHCCCQF